MSSDQRAGHRPFWFSALTVLVNVGLVVGFVAWLGSWGLVPGLVSVFVASFAAAEIEHRRWRR